jgi:SAM-dependent methyltransferase
VAEATDADASALLLAERAGVEDGDRLLDAGCGVGGPAVAIATRHRRCRIDGVTVSRAQAHELIALTRQRSIDERVGVTRGDYHALPFRDGCFDGALFLESIGYSPDHGTLFAEARRVVRPGGRIYVKDVFLGAADPESLPAPQRDDLRRFEELWCLSASPTFGGVAAALAGAGCEVLRCGELADVGTAHMLAAMIEPDADLIFRLTPLGETFATPSLDLPLVFGEVLAVVG